VADSARIGSIQSVSRAIAILRCFNVKRELGITEISQIIGLHKSTVAGIVNTLRAEKFLDHNPENGKYQLGIGLFQVSVNAKLMLRTTCQPYLLQLMEQFGETVNLALPDETDIVYIEKMESLHSVRICTKIGQKIPFYCTAIGKAIFAYLEPGHIESVLNGLKFEKFTPNTITDAESLKMELASIRRIGVAYDNQELESGLICLAVPIFNNTGRPFAGISISGPTVRMPETLKDEIAQRLKLISGSISKKLYSD